MKIKSILKQPKVVIAIPTAIVLLTSGIVSAQVINSNREEPKNTFTATKDVQESSGGPVIKPVNEPEQKNDETVEASPIKKPAVVEPKAVSEVSQAVKSIDEIATTVTFPQPGIKSYMIACAKVYDQKIGFVDSSDTTRDEEIYNFLLMSGTINGDYFTVNGIPAATCKI